MLDDRQTGVYNLLTIVQLCSSSVVTNSQIQFSSGALLCKPNNNYRGALHPDPDPAGYPVNLVDPGRIRIRPDPMYLDLVWIWMWPDSTYLDPVRIRHVRIRIGSGSGRIAKFWILCTPKQLYTINMTSESNSSLSEWHPNSRAFLGATENAGPGQCRTWKMTGQIAGLENARPGKRRTTSQGVENARPTKMTEQIAGLTMQDQWMGGKTLHFLANITNILSWNYLEQIM